MKTYSADLLALLAAKVPVGRTDLFAFGPCQNGAMIYACTGQLPVTYGGNVYLPGQFGRWSRGSITTKIGLESNACDLSVVAGQNVPVDFPGTNGSAQLLDGIKFGLLGNANVSIYTLYNSDYLPGYSFPATTGPTGGSLVETKFIGQCAALSSIGMTKATVTVQDMLYLLNIQVPRRVFQASCSHTLYDAGCKLQSANFTRAGVVASLTYPYQIATSAHLAPFTPAGTFAQGVLAWTSGANQGLSSFVAAWTAGSNSDTIQLDVAPIFPIQPGDAFKLTQGCNKTLAACADLQGTSAAAYTNYGGQPDTPVPETAIGGGA
jgi:hypothetical protein